MREEWDRKRGVGERLVLFAHSLPQMLATDRVGPGRSQELRTQSVSPTWVAGTQGLEPLPTASHGAHAQGTASGLRTGIQSC